MKRAFFLCLVCLCSDLVRAESAAKFCEATLAADLNKKILFHNPAVAGILRGTPKRASILALTQTMFDQHAFEFPIEPGGFVTAAPVVGHGGNYGNFIWLRDLARTFQGAKAFVQLLDELVDGRPDLKPKREQAASDARTIALGLLKILGSSHFREQALRNIENPAHSRDPHLGYRNVIWIRMLLKPLAENRGSTEEEWNTESQWGHKQNDALALFAQAILDALDAGLLRASDFGEAASENFLLLPAYFTRIEYWNMRDTGAWEEGEAVRTSSVALVTGFLEGFARRRGSGPLSEFLSKPNLFLSLSADRRGSVRNALATERQNFAIERGNQTVEARLSARLPAEEVADDGRITRGADTALLHALWYPLASWRKDVRLKLMDGVQTLERPSGYNRYEHDWFLYGSAMGAAYPAESALTRSIAIPAGTGVRLAGPDDLRHIRDLHKQHMYDKDMRPVEAFSGSGLEAQWTIPDSILAQSSADLAAETRDPLVLKRALRHFKRAAGLITNEGELTTDGLPVRGFRVPEAYIPVRRFRGSNVVTEFMVSPNSPLNWATAEFAIATLKILRALPQD